MENESEGIGDEDERVAAAAEAEQMISAVVEAAKEAKEETNTPA